jgi:hypothetical protein
MDLSLRRLTWLALIAALVPGAVRAQSVVFSDLSWYVKPGDTVSVDAGGQQIKGKVTTLTAASLTLQLDDLTKDFPEAAVRRVVVHDSRLNGALIGAAAGAVPGTMLGFGWKQYCENESASCPAAPLVFGAVFGAAGAAIGAGIDGLIRRTIFVSPRRSPHLTVSPELGPHRRGIVVSVRF